jgi:hypothetical protein
MTESFTLIVQDQFHICQPNSAIFTMSNPVLSLRNRSGALPVTPDPQRGRQIFLAAVVDVTYLGVVDTEGGLYLNDRDLASLNDWGCCKNWLS